MLSGHISVTAPLPPFHGNKRRERLEIQPRHSLIKAAIEFLRTPSQLPAKHQFCLSGHSAIWLANTPVWSPFLFHLRWKSHRRNHHLTVKLFEKGQLVAETEIKYKLYFRTHQSHLPLPKANGRGCGRRRGISLLPVQRSVQPQGRMEMPGPRPTGQASSWNCLHPDQGRDKHPALFLYLL